MEAIVYIFSRQMEAIVYISSNQLVSDDRFLSIWNVLYNTLKLKTKENFNSL